jgi:hypothetical protein
MTKAYYIPNGPKNLSPLFGTIDFSDIESYFVEVLDEDNSVVASSPLNQIDGCCDDDKIRLHFLNYLGSVDAINFKLLTLEHESKSDALQRAVSYPLNKPTHAGARINVKSNDTYTAVCTDYTEKDKDWIDELFDSPLSWMEWSGIQGQDDSYIPIVILDKKFLKVAQDDRFIYEITIDFQLSHDRFIIRN